MSVVQTIFGLVPREFLEVKDVVQEAGNSRAIASEWRLTCDLADASGVIPEFKYDDGRVVRAVKGELAKRDVTCSILAPEQLGGEQGPLPG